MTLSGHHRPYRYGIPTASASGPRRAIPNAEAGEVQDRRVSPFLPSRHAVSEVVMRMRWGQQPRPTESAETRTCSSPTLPKPGRGKPLPARAQRGQDHAPRGHVTNAPCSPIPGCRWAHLAGRRGSQGGRCFNQKWGSSRRNERSDGRDWTSGWRWRACAPPSGGNGGKTRGRARGRPVTACVRVAGDECRCPQPEAALAAVGPRTERPNGRGPTSSAARWPPGSPPPARLRSGAPPLLLAANASQTREARYGLPRRAVRASQVVSPSPEAGRRGGRAAPLLPAESAASQSATCGELPRPSPPAWAASAG